MSEVQGELTLVEQPLLRVAALRHLGPYTEIGQAFGRLVPIADAAGLLTQDALLLGIYHDDPAVKPAAELRSDAGVLLDIGVKLPDGLTEVILAPGQYARLRHLGPYNLLPAAWSRIKQEWTVAGGLRRRVGPSYEVYLNSPMDTAPADLITDIYVPVSTPA